MGFYTPPEAHKNGSQNGKSFFSLVTVPSLRFSIRPGTTPLSFAVLYAVLYMVVPMGRTSGIAIRSLCSSTSFVSIYQGHRFDLPLFPTNRAKSRSFLASTNSQFALLTSRSEAPALVVTLLLSFRAPTCSGAALVIACTSTSNSISKTKSDWRY